MSDKGAFHRIQVHVPKFLDFLFVTPDIEIIEANLPKLRQSRIRSGRVGQAFELGGAPFGVWFFKGAVLDGHCQGNA